MSQDNGTLVQIGDQDTLGSALLYELSVTDIIGDSMSDHGTDILGPSDSIMGGCDTYSLIEGRILNSTILDLGVTSSPYYLYGWAWDNVVLDDTGSSTLTTNGHVYATDTFGYGEASNDTATETQSESGLYQSATAYDYDVDSVAGTITVSDTATTSFDSFEESNEHSVSAYVGGSSTDSTSAESWYDYGYDYNVLGVWGTESSTGCSYSFVDTDSSGYHYILHKVVTGSGPSGLNYDLTIAESSETSISGTATGNPDPYSFVSLSTESYFETDSGATTDTLGTVNDFSYVGNSSDAYEYTLSGPPASTITDESTTTASSSGSPQDSSNGELIPAYWDTDAMGLATSMGTSPLYAPIQDGTTSGEWDTSQGLASAVGGQDMHALQFTGAEVQPALSGSAVALEQGGGGSGIWASHPSAIGYRRQGYTTGGSHGGSGSGTITIAAVAPEFDSGMNAGTGQDEVERLGNFGQGAEENPTVAQSQPIARCSSR